MTEEKMNILKDKVIVVVGTSSGIGAAVSEYFSDHGAITCIFARRKRTTGKIMCSGKRKESKDVFLYKVTREIIMILPRWQEHIVWMFRKIDVWN